MLKRSKIEKSVHAFVRSAVKLLLVFIAIMMVANVLGINTSSLLALLSVIGLAVSFKALVVETEGGDKIGAIAWKPLGFIIAANLLFGVLLGGLPSIGLPAMGLIAAIFGLTLVSSLAGDTYNIKEVLVLATILAAGSYVAFVWLLKLQFPVWPSFITG